MIQSSAEKLLITLSSDAEFTLDGNVLTQNQLNRIMIQGSGLEGREHVEFKSQAFNDNSGPFPEIEIVNINTVIIRPNAFFCKSFVTLDLIQIIWSSEKNQN